MTRRTLFASPLAWFRQAKPPTPMVNALTIVIDGQEIARAVAQSIEDFNRAEDERLINGTGVGAPQGLLFAPDQIQTQEQADDIASKLLARHSRKAD